MAAKFVIFVTISSALFFSTSFSYAQCCASRINSDCQPLCCQPLYPEWGCDCADLGMYENQCIDRSTYCEAFGNIGAR